MILGIAIYLLKVSCVLSGITLAWTVMLAVVISFIDALLEEFELLDIVKTTLKMRVSNFLLKRKLDGLN